MSFVCSKAFFSPTYSSFFKGFVPVQPEDHDDVNLGTYVREFASHREHKVTFFLVGEFKIECLMKFFVCRD